MRALICIVLATVLFSCERTKMDKTLPAGSFDTKPIAKPDYGKDRDLDKDGYLQYVTDRSNGLVIDKEIGDVQYTLFFKPLEYLAIKNMGDQTDKSRVIEEVESLKDLQYYNFKIAIKNFNQEILKYKLGSEQEYTDRVSYLAFGMQQDIRLVEGLDTLPCALFHFERNYGVAPNANFVLAFEKSKSEKMIYSRTLMFEDKIFGTGKVNMTIEKESIAQLPGLNIN